MEKDVSINDKDILLSSLTNDYDEKEEEKEIIFNNYIPEDKNFKIEKCPKTFEVKAIEDKIKSNVLKSVKEFLNLEKNNNLLKPAKKDFDLKRNIAQKMDYLNALTIDSIKEMVNNNQK